MSRMTITVDGRVVTYDVAEVDAGPMSARGKPALRPIEAMGVNGREFQEMGLRTEMITLTTTESTRDYVQSERRAKAIVGEQVRIRYESPTGVVVWDDAVIVDVVVLRRSGQMFGRGSREGDTNTLMLQWQIDIVPETV